MLAPYTFFYRIKTNASASRYRLMHGHQLAAIGESRLHLDIGDHFSDTVHHILARQHLRAIRHQPRHRLAVARTLHDGCADEGHRFRVIQFQAARQAPLGQQRRRKNEQLVFFAWAQIHSVSLSCQVFQMRGTTATRPMMAGRSSCQAASMADRAASLSAPSRRTATSVLICVTPRRAPSGTAMARSASITPAATGPPTASRVAHTLHPCMPSGLAIKGPSAARSI